MAFRTSGGLAYNQAKSVCKFYFSEYFHAIKKDWVEKCYHIWLLPGLETEGMVEYFQSHWGAGGYRFYLFSPDKGATVEDKIPYLEKDKLKEEKRATNQ